MVRTLLVGWLAMAALACSHHAPATTDPSNLPTLPPSSGTPVGILIDEATSLHLRDDQVDHLRKLDTQLATRNDPIDAQLRTLDQPAGPPPARRGGGGNPALGHVGGSHHHHRPSGGTAGGDPSIRQRLVAERTANARDVVTQALQVLDVGQRDAATKLLAEHGVDLAAPALKPAAGDESSDGSDGADDPTEF